LNHKNPKLLSPNKIN